MADLHLWWVQIRHAAPSRGRQPRLAIIDRVAANGPKRERTLYEIASSFFAVCVILFALAGMVAAATGDEGIVSAGFAICVLFLLLGIGRLYLGWVRGNEGAEELERAADSAPTEPRPAKVARGPRSPRRGGH